MQDDNQNVQGPTQGDDTENQPTQAPQGSVGDDPTTPPVGGGTTAGDGDVVPQDEPDDDEDDQPGV